MTAYGRMKKDLPAENRLVPRPEPAGWTAGEDPVTFTLTANAGIMACYGKERLLIDGLHNGAECFSRVPPELLKAITEGRPPFSGIGWLLYTHLHTDHFSAGAAACFLARHPGARLILPAGGSWWESEMAALKAVLEERRVRFWEVDTPPGDFFCLPAGEGIQLRVFAARHAGAEYRDVPHVCFLLAFGERNVLILGDADYDADYFAGMLRGIPVHAAVVNPLYISSAKGRRTLLEGIRPERVIVCHIPFQGEDPMRLREITARCLIRHRSTLPPAAVLWSALDSAVF